MYDWITNGVVLLPVGLKYSRRRKRGAAELWLTTAEYGKKKGKLFAPESQACGAKLESSTKGQDKKG